MYSKRTLSEKLQIFKSLHFPYKKRDSSPLRYSAIVGIGGNVGDVKRRFEHLFFEIQREKRVELLKSALILKNPPFGFVDQDDFFNSILLIKTSMQPRAFLEYLLRLEKKFKRERSFENAPRTLDLDIIFFENRVIKSPKLTLPHPFWKNRESVIIPLSSLQA